MSKNIFWYRITFITFDGVLKSEYGHMSIDGIINKVNECSSFGNELVKFTMKRGQ